MSKNLWLISVSYSYFIKSTRNPFLSKPLIIDFPHFSEFKTIACKVLVTFWTFRLTFLAIQISLWTFLVYNKKIVIKCNNTFPFFKIHLRKLFSVIPTRNYFQFNHTRCTKRRYAESYAHGLAKRDEIHIPASNEINDASEDQQFALLFRSTSP